MIPAPSPMRFAPWTDRRGRFHTLRAVVFALLLVPAAWLAGRWAMGGLGPRPINEAIHSTGYAAVWVLVASLAISPAKTLLGQPNLIVVRRMVGNAALAYATAHLVLYCAQQDWHPLTIVTEIALRFYLTIGFIALLGLVALGATSTDGWIRSMGRNWKRMHRMVYGLAALTLAHYVLQTKLDVSQAMLAIGVFTWFMLWRVLPEGRERDWPTLLALSAVAATAMLGAEYLWYTFGTHVNALKVVAGEFDITYGLHPAGQVLAAGLLATAITELSRIAETPFGQRPLFTVAVYALGAFADSTTAFILAWPTDDDAALSPFASDCIWAALLALLGAARWNLRDRWYCHLIDAVWIACLLDQVLRIGAGNRIASAVALMIVGGASIMALRVWHVSRTAAATLLPLVIALTWEVLSPV